MSRATCLNKVGRIKKKPLIVCGVIVGALILVKIIRKG